MSQEADMERNAVQIANDIVSYFQAMEDCAIDWYKARRDMREMYLEYTRPLIEEP